MIWHNIDVGIEPYFESDDVLLFNGDCMEILPLLGFMRTGASPKLILTDPPYDFIAVGGGMHKQSKSMDKMKEIGVNKFDFKAHIPGILAWQRSRGTKINSFFFCNLKLVYDYIRIARKNKLKHDILIMKKERCVPAHSTHFTPDVEYIIRIHEPGSRFVGNLDEGLYDPAIYSKVYSYLKGNTLHPNEKPIPLLKTYILITTYEGDVVIDPFMGSGTTGMACLETGRLFIGIDKDQSSVEMTISRLSQQSLF